MRNVVLALAALQLLALAPVSEAQEAPVDAAPLDAADALLSLNFDDPVAVLLQQFEHQGAFPPGTVLAARAQSRPPGLAFRDARPACDLDGDGRDDWLLNELTLQRPPSLAPSDTRLSAVSGADGATLWSRDELTYIQPPSPPGAQTMRVGRAAPTGADNAFLLPDANGDGACDALAIGYERGPSFAAPYIGSPSVREFTLTVTLVSGKDGADLWRVDLPGRIVDAGDPLFSSAQTTRVENFLTGALLVPDASGPRVVLKTTDLEYSHASNPVWFTTSGPFLNLEVGRFVVDDLHVTDRIQMLDGATGKVAWQRALASPANANSANLTWLSGAADLAGGPEPDVLLDQLTLQNPRSNEQKAPVTDEPLFRYGRGMGALALDGKDGKTAWAATLVDLVPAKPRAPDSEENFETLAWTYARIGPDVDGDGRADPLASYVVREEGMGGSIEGSFLTHFAGLSGANGTKRWDVRQQGWGVLRGIGQTADTAHLLGMGMVDVPTGPSPGGRFPPKMVRMGALDARDGSTVWSYEKSFAQNSYLSYNLALGQYEDALAPLDLDRDGVLDLVTPAQYAPATGADQVLLATSHHEYEVRSGRDGAVLRSIPVWGPQGRALDCGADGSTLTFLSGHGRRLDLTRVDAATGATVWRVPVHNDPAPRAATSGMDVPTLGARCHDDAEGTTFTLDMQAYSVTRRHEVVAVNGALQHDGTVAWMDPAPLGTPDADERLFQASLRASKEDAKSALVPALAIGGILGAAGAGGTLLVAQRGGGRIAKVLGVTLVLLLLAPAPASALAGLPLDLAPRAADAPSLASAPVPLAQPRFAAAAGNETHFNDEDTTAFTYPIPDVDGDGVDDLVVDHYCDSYECYDGPNWLQDPANYALAYRWDQSHRLYGVSGATRDILWDVDLAVPGPVHFIGDSFVLGTAPLSNTTGVLVYTLVREQHTVTNVASTLHHTLRMLDARSGVPLWSWESRGAFATDIFTTLEARDVSLQPVLGTDADGHATLLVHGVGYTQHFTHTSLVPLDLAGFGGPVQVVSAMVPADTFTRLDPETGKVLWRRDDVFVGEKESAYVTVTDDPQWLLVYPGYTEQVGDRYWDAAEGCCADVTGDGQPDVLARVLRWARTPNANPAGPHDWSSGVLVLDGKDGSVARTTPVRDDFHAKGGRAFTSRTFMGATVNLPAYSFSYQPIGDVDGDGAEDLLQHETLLDADTLRTMGVVSGKTGALLWQENRTRDVRAIPIGDADGDGAADVVTFDWFSHEAATGKLDDYSSPDATPVVARSGKDGHELWRAVTYTAPADLEEQFRAMRRNGLVDVDGDGVGDVTLDAPEYLGDQTVIHHLRVASGRDGRTLHETTSVGAFALPTNAGDLDRNGRDEYAVLSGDVNDLWLTLRKDDGTAAWSRRVVAAPASSYATALPKLRVHLLKDANGTQDALALDFHLHLTLLEYHTGLCIACGDDGETVREWVWESEATLPQVLSLDARTGAEHWGVPDVQADALKAYVAGETPGTVMLQRVVEAASPLAQAEDALPAVAAGGATFGAVYAAGLGVIAGVVRWSRRFEGVPDLE